MPPPLPPPSSSSSSSSSLNTVGGGPAATANIRVLVRVRPHNNQELTESGSIGRSNVLTLETKSKNSKSRPNQNQNQRIDFGFNNHDSSKLSSPSSTITVKGLDENDDYNSNSNSYSSSSSAVSSSSSLSSRRSTMGSSSMGYTSDDNNNNSTNNITTHKQFTFDAVHGPRSTQCEVYESVKGIVDAVAAGYNGTIVAYGQTGSGKTHTVFGSGRDESNTGLVQRSIRDIFQKITMLQAEQAANNKSASDSDNDDDEIKENGENGGSSSSSSSTATFHGSFFEIFNERVYDLLANDSTILENNSLTVREGVNNGVYVEGLKEIQVSNSSHAEALLAKGLANRHVASTKMNRTSSRSHAVFVLSVKTETVTADGLRKVRSSKFTLVDLAGSERQKSTAAYGSRLKEASMINKSLLCLGHVINALVEKEAGNTRHVPFRDSKLTFLLRDTWGGNSKTCLVATVSPSGLSLSETVSTLKFAQRAKLIKNNAVLNEDTCGTVAALQAEVAKLRSELERNSNSNSSNSNSVEGVKRRKAPILSCDADVVAVMKRRAERAERKIAQLEKMVSEEQEVACSLKRKLQEETMVRKFKERRLSYFQTKDGSSVGYEQNQVQLLQDEISSLQKRLETPSPEAIEWRVAYEEIKEELRTAKNSDESAVDEMKKKNSDLEATIERLCLEKLKLEDKVSEMIKSSNETRSEIDSMINEVVRLENDMTSLQEQLKNEKARSSEFHNLAENASDQLQQSESKLDQVINEKMQMELEINSMKTKLDDLGGKIDELNNILKQKQSEIIEMETLSRENELELQYTIEELERKLVQATTKVEATTTSQSALQEHLDEATSKNEKLNTELQKASHATKEQLSTISSLEEKLTNLTEQKNSALATIKKHEEDETELNEKVSTMRLNLEEAQRERQNLELRLSCVKEQAELAASALEEKTVSVHSFQNEIIKLKGVHAEEMRLSNEGRQMLENKVAELETAKEEVQKIQSELRRKQEIVTDLDQTVQGITNELHEYMKEKEAMQKHLEEEQSMNKRINAEVSQLKKSLTEKEEALRLAKEERDAYTLETDKNYEELQLRLTCQIEQLKNERSEDLKLIKSKDVHLERSEAEIDMKMKEIEEKNVEISKLRAENSSLEARKTKEFNEIRGQLTDVEERLSKVMRTNEKFEDAKEEIAQKQNEIIKLRTERDDLHATIDAKKKSLIALEQSHAASIQDLSDSKRTLQNELNTCKSNLDKSSMHQKELQLQMKELEMKLKHNEEDTARKMEELQIQIREKDSLIKMNEQEHEKYMKQRDIEVSNLEKSKNSAKVDYSRLVKEHKSMSLSNEEIKKKILMHQDQVVLLQREKGHLKFELENLREDQDALNEQVRTLTKNNKLLQLENQHLKETIDNIKNEDLSLCTVVGLSKASTFENDSNISYDDLNTEMDSMLGKISSHSGGEEKSHCAPMEESFDESMFLPNIEVSGNEENAQNANLSTPSKCDYGEKRQPLTDRKSNKSTPLRSLNKMIRSSTKKLKSSKKQKSNYMMFDNKRLFGNKS